MNISVGNLMITSFCENNAKHRKFRLELAHDEKIYEFVSVCIMNDLTNDSNSNNIELGHSYIIENNRKLVGYIYIEEIDSIEGTIELRYAVHPEYRNIKRRINTKKSYGQMILEECSNYLFTLDNINNIDLHIRKDNEISIKCAEKSKYKCIGTNEEYYYYIYRRKREDYERDD